LIYTLSDLSSTKELPDLEVLPNDYIILTKSKAELESVREIDENAIVVEMSIPSMNNSSDALVLKGNDLVDSLYYTTSNYEKGISLERADFSKPFLNENMKICKNPEGATCGYENSHIIKQYDLALTNFDLDLTFSTIYIEVTNYGIKDVNDFIINFSNKDNIFYSYKGDLILSNGIESVEIDYDEFVALLNNSGNLEIKATIEFDEDQDYSNNGLTRQFYISDDNIELLINEFMFDVSGDNYEFIELFNNSENEIQLNGFRLYDAAGDFDDAVILDSLIIKSNGYALVAWDEAILERHSALNDSNNFFISEKSINLNNSGDDIYLVDPNGFVVDSVFFDDNWHEESQAFTDNISLEKINPGFASNEAASWTSSASSKGSTPGQRNSVYTEVKREGRLNASPNPFAPNGDFSENKCIITYELPFSRGRMIAKIYTKEGIEVNEIANNQYTSSEDYIIWDGTDKNNNVLPPGAYVLYLEALSLESSDVFSDKILIVIGNK
jgi:hypothetical protein